MTPKSGVLKLATQIQALPPGDRLELLRNVLTPELEIQVLVEDLRGRAAGHDPRIIARDVDQTVREIRGERKLKGSS
ncbi:MAG: hypothetical protein GY856_32965 [bacterium]|nr:hypothetical protein [bacterium]